MKPGTPRSTWTKRTQGSPGPQGPQGPVGPQGPQGQIIGQPYVPGNQPPQQVVLDTSGLERTFVGMAGAVERLAQQQFHANDQFNESVREQRKE